MNRKPIIAIIGDAKVEPGSANELAAYELGKMLVDSNYRIQSGGMGGIMEAAAKGASHSENHSGNEIIGIIPGFNPAKGNRFNDIAIATGMDVYRNVIVANADAIVAIGGGAGTLSEMASAWTMKRLMMGYDLGGWSARLAGTRIDDRIRYEGIADDQVFKVHNANDVLTILDKYLSTYQARFNGLQR